MQAMLQISQAEVTQPRQAASIGTLFVLGSGLLLYQLTSLVLAPSARELAVAANIPLIEVDELAQPREQGAEFARAHFWAPQRASVRSSEDPRSASAALFSLAPVQTLVRETAVPASSPPAIMTISLHRRVAAPEHRVTAAVVPAANTPAVVPAANPPASDSQQVGQAKPALAPVVASPVQVLDLNEIDSDSGL
jgi:hypothetical protein